MKPIHKKILDKLTELCENHPEQRFGQLLFNYTKIGTVMNISEGLIADPFHYQDEEFLDSMKNKEEE